MRSPLDPVYDRDAATLAQAAFYIVCGMAVLGSVALVLLLELW